jgi:hypothetical protein
MLKSTMQKEPKIVAAKFHAIFNTRFQLALIGALLGMIAVKLMGS